MVLLYDTALNMRPSLQETNKYKQIYEGHPVAAVEGCPRLPDRVIESLVTASPRGDRVKSDGYKRAFDLTTLIFFHVILLPVWLVLWSLIPLAIWLADRGPVFYPQKRLGKDGRVFTLVKFRTMIKDAERGTGMVWAAHNDSRITPVGKVLRKLHLDEMPQVINIFRGEMSLVGPRPERPELYSHFCKETPNFYSRLHVLPGITGLAQLRGCYHTAPRDKMRYDNLYIKHFCPMLDLKLLLLTPIVVLFGKKYPPPPPPPPESGLIRPVRKSSFERLLRSSQ